jgi:hypothetical protein
LKPFPSPECPYGHVSPARLSPRRVPPSYRFGRAAQLRQSAFRINHTLAVIRKNIPRLYTLEEAIAWRGRLAI